MALRELARRGTALGTATILILSLSACIEGSGDVEDDDFETAQSNPFRGEEEDSVADPTGRADWANPYTNPGDKLTSFEAGDIEITVYQVNVVKSPKASNAVDPETNEPIINKGDKIVFVNFVITNTGDIPINLGESLVTVDGEYDDWKHGDQMPSIKDSELFEYLNVNASRLAPGKSTDPAIYPLKRNGAFTFGTNYLYQKDSDITFTAKYLPVDDQGEPLRDEKVKSKSKAKIE